MLWIQQPPWRRRPSRLPAAKPANNDDGKGQPEDEDDTDDKSRLSKAVKITQIVGNLGVFVSVAALVVGIWQFKAQQDQSATQALDQQRQTATQALDQQRQNAISQYYDDISALVLQKDLTSAIVNAPARAIAEARTYTTLRVLDGGRKGDLIRYLWEAGLVRVPNPTLSLLHADLRGLSLPAGTNLYGVDLPMLDMAGATLDNVQLYGANLNGSGLAGANLSDADLRGADLAGAYLTGANLSGATYNVATIVVSEPDGPVRLPPTTWPSGFKLNGTGAVCVDC